MGGLNSFARRIANSSIRKMFVLVSISLFTAYGVDKLIFEGLRRKDIKKLGKKQNLFGKKQNYEEKEEQEHMAEYEKL